MLLQDSKLGKLDNLKFISAFQSIGVTQDAKLNNVDSSTPLNSSLTCLDKLGMTSILTANETEIVIKNDEFNVLDFSNESHNIIANDLVFLTPINCLSTTSTNMDISNKTKNKNIDSMNER